MVCTASEKRVKARTGHVDELVGYIFMDCPVEMGLSLIGAIQLPNGCQSF